ncbi:hypothetical protein [Kitasatospora indigofera]|uniref:hypothetical protein n=1 Tax=Kitasatospora indigofera TaxID=67307 RepID=UPI0033A58C84
MRRKGEPRHETSQIPDRQQTVPSGPFGERRRPTLWSTAGITVDPLPIAGDKDPALSSSVDKRRFASIPWALLALLVPLGLLGGWWWSRRHGTPAGLPPAGPGGTPVGSPPAGPAEPPVAAGAGAGPSSGPPFGPASGPSSGPGAVVAATTLLLAALLLCQLPFAPTASAAEPVGTPAFDYATGRDDDALDLLSSGQCPDPAADHLAVRITGEGFPAEGAPLTGTVAASVYRTAANGGYVLPLSNTLRVVANRSGAGRLTGAYTITASCRGKVSPISHRDFTGVLTFTTPTTWQAVTVAPEGLIHDAAAAAEPAPPAAASPAPAAVAAAPRPSGTPWFSLLAVGAGALLLGRTALPYARRWRRRPAPETAE